MVKRCLIRIGPRALLQGNTCLPNLLKIVESSVIFIPESPDGKVDLPFTIDSSDGEDRVVEIFVEIFLAE